MRARTLMVQGTMSSVGKSLMVATLCRIFKQDGWRVAPFKAQNMALNSFATRDGREVGRSQAMQADAAGVDVTVEMNPVLIKPEADSFAQIIVMGKPWARLPAGEYMARRSELWSVVTGALDSLRAQYDLVVIEGAGSPAELNLRRGDLVNMSVAEYADAPVILVGDIDRGGIFAQLLGTLWCLDERERTRVRAFIVNKFRGDARLFDEGVKILEARGGVRVLGVMPFIRDLCIADEDSVALESVVSHQSSVASIDIVVIRLPHISNFDDFDPLRTEPDVSVRFIDRAENLAQPDLIILPGTKTTIADLQFLRERGIADRIVALAHAGVPVLGICGGYQMLGKTIGDPGHVESDMDETDGLGLLSVVTTFAQEKLTARACGRLIADAGLFENARDVEIIGYEIHMGHTNLAKISEPSQGLPGLPLQRVIMRGENGADDFDGTVSGDGWIAGTYFHGLFNNDALRHALLSNLAACKNVVRATSSMRFDREVTYERLAEIARAHIDMSAINRLLE